MTTKTPRTPRTSGPSSAKASEAQRERVRREVEDGLDEELELEFDEERIRQGGCEAYLSKPISVKSFVDTVRRFIGDA